MDPRRANQAAKRASRSSGGSGGVIRQAIVQAFTLVELLIVVVIMGLALVLALPSRSSTARTQLLGALRIIQADVYTMQSMARAAPPEEIYAMIMHYPDAPLVDAGRLDMTTALVQVSTGGCCVGGDCWDNQTLEYCASEVGFYLGDNNSCLLYDKGKCTIADPPTNAEVDSALQYLPDLPYAGTLESPNASPALAASWPGTLGGPDFESVGNKDGDKESFYSCGIILDADTPDERYSELTRPDGRPWNFNFAEQGLELVTIAAGNASDFYSQERALRFDHRGMPSRNVLFTLEADKHALAVAISTSGEVHWSLITTNKGGKGGGKDKGGTGGGKGGGKGGDKGGGKGGGKK